jgi:hypothetical protein
MPVAQQTPKFTKEAFVEAFQVSKLDTLPQQAARTAIKDPKAFYVFLKRYS